MAAVSSGPRKSHSIYDYPEHLNPFREDDNHRGIRFWTLGKKINRSNSINFSGIKELKNSWALRSFMRKGKKAPTATSTPLPEKHQNNQANNSNSPIQFRRALQYSSIRNGNSRATVGISPEKQDQDRYVYGGSVTPLPRTRFQERLRSTSNYEVNSISPSQSRMAHSEVSGSRMSVESTNPFDDGPVPPVRASRRKKKQAPLPPSADVTVNSTISEITDVSQVNSSIGTEEKHEEDLDKDYSALNVELKIVEDDEVSKNENNVLQIDDHSNETKSNVLTTSETKSAVSTTTEIDNCIEKNISADILPKTNENIVVNENDCDSLDVVIKNNKNNDDDMANNGKDADKPNNFEFPKVDIIKYRRNSSLNEDDIKLRRDKLNDIYTGSNKRSKSLNNELNNHIITYDINLNESKSQIYTNGNEEPKKVICKLYDEKYRKHSLDNSISSTEKEFIEIDKATKELEREINKLNSALVDEDSFPKEPRLSVSEIKRKFDNNFSKPNPIPKPARRSNFGSHSPINNNNQT